MYQVNRQSWNGLKGFECILLTLARHVQFWEAIVQLSLKKKKKNKKLGLKKQKGTHRYRKTRK